ncbi:PREDICTED: uncharacterized protein LOC105109549 [Populus euphratica]|uniref:Uncharacterized protein LOC105109549 n=1 Tax=Populus euphratica TaxID=75702 RepID=A0AAJ6T1Q1_POPEU|nr:PREDICTED: uncharacterized protein LOC105109549 [Populus euphratica]
MLQTLLELPSSLVGLDVSYCYSLQRIANLIPFTIARDCDQLVHIQDLIKLELIQKVDSHLLRIMEMAAFKCRRGDFRWKLQGNRFNVVLEYDENEMLGFHEEEWLIQKEFEEHLPFKISSPATHQICGFNLFTWFSATPVSNPYLHVYLEIRNNTKGRVWVFYPSIFPIEFSAEKSDLLWLSYWKFGSNDPGFDAGDEFSVSVFTDNPVVQIMRVGVLMVQEEEGTDDDSSSSNTRDDVHVAAKAEIASHIFRKYFCSDRYDFDNEISQECIDIMQYGYDEPESKESEDALQEAQKQVLKVNRKKDNKVKAIIYQESKEVDKLTVDELMSSLQAYEQKIVKRNRDKAIERALQAKLSLKNRYKGRGGRNTIRGGQGQQAFTLRGRGGGYNNRDKKNIQCYNYNQLGHYNTECQKKTPLEVREYTNYAEEDANNRGAAVLLFNKDLTRIKRIFGILILEPAIICVANKICLVI